MLKKVVHITLLVWLTILLLFGTAPKELIHSFASHTDTVDKRPAHGLILDSKHHHCAFLGFTLMPFERGYQLPELTYRHIEYAPTYTSAVPGRYLNDLVAVTSLRGPPGIAARLSVI